MLTKLSEENMFNKINASVIGASLCAAYGIYYALYVVHQPRVVAGPRFKSFLLTHCPILRERYWPTFWCFTGRSQTIISAFLKSRPEIHYYKELLALEDGGQVALDWHHNEDSPHNAISKPTVILLPGLTGSSEESYILHFVDQVRQMGYRSVVFNNRGNGGAELKTPVTYCACKTEDLRAVIAHIGRKYPGAPLIAAGVSLGGIILSNYLTHHGPDSGLVAAFTVSTAWNPFETSKSLEQPLNHFLFNSHLCGNLKAMIKKYKDYFDSDYDWDYIMKSQRVRDFDDRFIARQFGYPSWQEYYEDMSLHVKVHEIRTPLLAINAHDDPFAPGDSLPLEEVEQSQHTSIVVPRYGGHIGFLEGVFPRETSYVDRLFAQYIRAVFENQAAFNKSFS